MTDVYELHVAGLISPVVRAAIPELVAATGSRDTVLSGRVTGPGDIDDLLERLDDHGLTVTHIVIARHTRWHETSAPPGEHRPRRVVMPAWAAERPAGRRASRTDPGMTLLDFEIRVTGPVPAAAIDEIPGARVVVQPIETILRGPVADRAVLNRLVNRLHALGLNLLEVRRVTPSTAPTRPFDGQHASSTATVPK